MDRQLKWRSVTLDKFGSRYRKNNRVSNLGRRWLVNHWLSGAIRINPVRIKVSKSTGWIRFESLTQVTVTLNIATQTRLFIGQN